MKQQSKDFDFTKKIISSSELIINPDGSIYHLNLLPDDVADIIITVGDQERVDQVSKYFDEIEIKKQKREFKCHTGWLNKKRITVISSGIGTDNIDILMNEIDALVNIDFNTRQIKEELKCLSFYRLGTSGGIHPDISLDSLLVSEIGIGMDNLDLFYKIPESHNERNVSEAINEAFNGQLKFYAVKGGDKLISKFKNHAEFKNGITYSAIGFYGPQGRALRNSLLHENYMNQLSEVNIAGRKVTNIEMETSGIYLLASDLGHEALSINVILANRQLGTFSKNPKSAIDNLIQRSLEIITD